MIWSDLFCGDRSGEHSWRYFRDGWRRVDQTDS